MSFWNKIEKRITEFADDLLPDDYKQELSGGYQRLANGDYEGAQAIAKRLLTLRENNPEAATLLGESLLGLGKVRKALESFEITLQAKPAHVDALIGKGQALGLLGEVENAKIPLQNAAQNAKDQSHRGVAHRELGRLYLRQNYVEKAVRELRKALAEFPSDASAQTLLGQSIVKLPSYSPEDAIQILDRALATNRDISSLLAKGQALERQEDFEEAQKYFKEATTLATSSVDPESKSPDKFDPEVSRAWFLLGTMQLENGNYNAAAKSLSQANVLNPQSEEIQLSLCSALGSAGKQSEALTKLKQFGFSTEGTCVLGLQLAIENEDWRLGEELLGKLEALATNKDKFTYFETLLAAGTQTTNATHFEKVEILPIRERALAQSALLVSTADTPGSDKQAVLIAAQNAVSQQIGSRAGKLEGSSFAKRLLRQATRINYPTSQQQTLASICERLAVVARDFSELQASYQSTVNRVSALDGPLIVAIMGEFSSGKSSFINSIVGEDVAATGVLPTTATLNIVKYGREHGGRVLWKNGHIEIVEWDRLFSRIAKITQEEADRIDLVEILLPREELQSLNFVDTPGLNSGNQAHEATTETYLSRADAVIWVFAAGQAGKASEQKALDHIVKSGTSLFAVMNKVDQLESSEIKEAKLFLEKSLTRYLSDESDKDGAKVYPYSATRAQGSPSERKELLDEIVRRLGARAKILKQTACRRELSELAESASMLVLKRRSAFLEQKNSCDNLILEIENRHSRQAKSGTATIRKELTEMTAKLYEQASAEVLDLVQPRKNIFGSHATTVADHDYLVTALEELFSTAVQAAGEKYTQLLDKILGCSEESETYKKLEEDITEKQSLLLSEFHRRLDKQVVGRTLSYVAGYLRGGYVDRFFRQDLPKLDLTNDNVFHALFSSAPDVERILASQFNDLLREAIAETTSHLAKNSDLFAIQAEELDRGVIELLTQAKSDLLTAV